MNSYPLIVITGPTAVGKTSLALELAQLINAEIISCDAMQVYKEVSIATAKPTADELARIPHHLINVLSVTEDFDAARYCALAGNAVRDIHSRGKRVIICGGSGMYLESLLDGLFDGPGRDDEFREKLQEEAESKGAEELHARLADVDPQSAANIHPNDLRRIIRALEVFHLTGKPKSVQQKDRKGLADEFPVKFFGIQRDRDELYERVNQRVDQMMAGGLAREVQALKEMTVSRTAQGIIGISELQAVEQGVYSSAEAVEIIKRQSRRLAKRQMTWFRHDGRINWCNVQGPSNPLTKKILREIE